MFSAIRQNSLLQCPAQSDYISAIIQVIVVCTYIHTYWYDVVFSAIRQTISLSCCGLQRWLIFPCSDAQEFPWKIHMLNDPCLWTNASYSGACHMRGWPPRRTSSEGTWIASKVACVGSSPSCKLHMQVAKPSDAQLATFLV